MKAMLKEFKEFAMRGNVMDMAIGIILGAAFGKIVSSFVSDVLMPPLGMLLGSMDFSSLAFTLKEATAEGGAAVTISYGVFINTLVDFVIVAFAIFLVVNQLNKLERQPPPPPPSTKECRFCFMSIPLKATRCPSCTSELEGPQG
jgi:large conductance mechanosensitive channel